MNIVSRTINEVVRNCRTTDPYQIAEYYNVNVLYAPTDDEFKALFLLYKGKAMIILNEMLRHTQEAYFYLYHELYHALVHHDIVSYYHTGVNVKGKKEREANQFAVYMSIIGKTIYEGQSVDEFMKVNYIPLEMREYLGGIM